MADAPMNLPVLQDTDYPDFVTTDAERYRYRVCAGITLMIAGKLDPVWCRQLYFSDVETGSGPSDAAS